MSAESERILVGLVERIARMREHHQDDSDLEDLARGLLAWIDEQRAIETVQAALAAWEAAHPAEMRCELWGHDFDCRSPLLGRCCRCGAIVAKETLRALDGHELCSGCRDLRLI